jgi:D-glycero-alpha-D-manno-heptose 1-phosphate guanylyltransferase
MRTIILAGGFGTRLQQVVPNLPKPLADIGGRPLLAWQLDLLVHQGASDIILCVHHLHERMGQFLQGWHHGIPMRCIVEQQPLGTGGALYHALREIRPETPVLVLNGDTFSGMDYRALYAAHLSHRAPVTIAVRHAEDRGRFGAIESEHGLITKYTSAGTDTPGLISTGTYVVSPQLFDAFSMPAMFSFERDFLEQHAVALRTRVFETSGYFVDIGVPEDYARAQEEIPEQSRELIAA